MSEPQPHAVSAHDQTRAQEVHVRPLLLFALGLIGLTGLVLLSMSWLFTATTARQARLDEPLAPMAQTASPLPPEPRLQVKPAQDWRYIRAAEEATLQSYGWVDRSAGVVRLPIARAIALLAERGLPHRTMDPSEPGVGGKGTP